MRGWCVVHDPRNKGAMRLQQLWAGVAVEAFAQYVQSMSCLLPSARQVQTTPTHRAAAAVCLAVLLGVALPAAEGGAAVDGAHIGCAPARQAGRLAAAPVHLSNQQWAAAQYGRYKQYSRALGDASQCLPALGSLLADGRVWAVGVGAAFAAEGGRFGAAPA